ncbi:hypothetical protein NIES4071_103510 (plasmid) [Calothrix sp. NIES-4071]|nr:hypothetical protein NIES4071_103510 [Calothrix sp. NIES-4071]BAZ64338.1 hypothetical protein NIES4105_100710 [Calothrix sp. NIES-4105]
MNIEVDTTEDNNKLHEYIQLMGIDMDDPIFNVYAQIGETQNMLQQLPAQISKIANGWVQMVDTKLDYAARVALQNQETAIAEAAKNLIKATGANIPLSITLSNMKIAQIAGGVGAILALGVGIGVFLSSTVATNTSTSGKPLSKADTQLLEWARSEDGKIARNVYNKNSVILKGCAEQSKFQGSCIIDINGVIPMPTRSRK